MSKVASIAKAFTAAVIAGLGALGTALIDDKSIGDVTDGQWVAVALAFFVALGGVWAVPNREPEA